MGLFGRKRYDDHREYSTHRRHHHVKDRDRVAGGYKAALANPNTTREGRRHAKRELEMMGRGREAHVPLMTKIKRALGIRSTPRSQRHREHHRRTYRRTEYRY